MANVLGNCGLWGVLASCSINGCVVAHRYLRISPVALKPNCNLRSTVWSGTQWKQFASTAAAAAKIMILFNKKQRFSKSLILPG
jgi:hypothetical protein